MNHVRRLLLIAGAVVGAAGIATTSWAYWSAQGSGTATATVGTWKTDTTTAVASSANPSLVGQQVTYTATVTAAGAGTPTGNVAFFNGASPIAECGGATGAALDGSTATCAQTYSAVGTHSISAQYLGDADFNASPMSVAITQVVNKGATATSLTVTGSPALYGNENTVVFTSAVTTAAGTPTGTVAIKQGGATLCEIDLPDDNSCSPEPTALDASPTAYAITAIYNGDDTYLGSTSSAESLVINKATPVISWDVPAPITYGTPLSAAQLDASANVPGTMSYNPDAGTVLPAGDHQLSVTFTPDDTTNYATVSAGVATLTVNKAPLTVTASDASKVYGAALPAFTATITGFVNSDPSTVVTGTASFTTTASAASPVDTYPITPAAGSLTASNYDFTFTNGTLTVNKATLTVTANNASKIYGSPNPTLSASITDFVNGDTSSAATGAATLSTTATTASNAGTYPITTAQGTLAATNYTFTFVNGTLTVTKASQTITFTSTAPSGAIADGSYTVTATGGGSGNPVSFTSASSSVCTVSGSTVSFVAAGTCVINANQAGNDNYSAASQAQQSFTINSTTVVITGVANAQGNIKVTFTGTGGAVGSTITVTVCKVNSFPCSTSTPNNVAGTATATVQSDGTWTTAATNNNLAAGNYWAQAVQTTPAGGTSAVFGSFQPPPKQ